MKLDYDAQTGVYNKPALGFQPIGGVQVPSWECPMILTTFSPPSRKPKVNVITTVPIIRPSGFAAGGQAVTVAPNEFLKVSMEGFIDTPTVDYGEYRLPNILVDGVRVTWLDFIVMGVEGRLNYWDRYDPTYFRDPYGRVYNNPRIMDIAGTYVEQVPGRTNFSMTLKV